MTSTRTTVLCGAFCIVASFALLYLVGIQLVTEATFAKRGRTVPGRIVSARESTEQVGEGRQRGWWSELEYEYELPGGRHFASHCRLQGPLEPWLLRMTKSGHAPTMPTPEKPCQVEVEYLPDEPTTSRIKGSSSMANYALLLVPSILLAVQGVRFLRKARRDSGT